MAPCKPALNFVQNGAAGSAFPPPLDPTPASFGPPSPTFEQTACELLGSDLCSSMDAIGAIDELPALTDTIDALTAAADSNLDAILLELDQLGQQQVHDSFDAFAGAQPGEQSNFDAAAKFTLPAVGVVPIVSPSGGTVVAPGAPPEQGGIAPAGGVPYVLHYAVPYVLGVPGAINTSRLTGPNPPFAALQGYEVVTDAAGHRQVNALIEINPAQGGEYHATITAHVVVSVTGITGAVDVTVPVTVVVQ